MVDLVARLDAWLIVALADDHNGRTTSALAALDSALGLARPQRVALPFLATRSTRLASLLGQAGGGGTMPITPSPAS